jgi:hypothetical protein
MTSLDALNPDFRDLLRALCETQEDFEPKGMVVQIAVAPQRIDLVSWLERMLAKRGLVHRPSDERVGMEPPAQCARQASRIPNCERRATAVLGCLRERQRAHAAGQRLWRSAAIARLGSTAAAWTRGAATLAGEPTQGG